MADTKISALPAATTPLAGTELVPIVQGGETKVVPVSGISSGGSASPGGSTTQVQFNNAGAFGGDAGFAFDNTTGKLTVGGKTVTASAPVLDLSQSWNASGVTFTGIKFNVTDTASAASSLLVDLQTGGSSRFSVDKNGVLLINTPVLADSDTLFDFKVNGVSKFKGAARDGFSLSMGSSRYVALYRDTFLSSIWGFSGSNTIFRLNSGGWVSWNPNATLSGNDDLFLLRDSANTLAQRNGVNAQVFRLYGTYTDASNYRRLTNTMSAAGVAEIKPEGAGTGATGNVLYISGLPTSNPGPGILWNNGGVVNVGT